MLSNSRPGHQVALSRPLMSLEVGFSGKHLGAAVERTWPDTSVRPTLPCEVHG